MRVSRKALLGIYSIVPLAGALVLVDWLFLDLQLRAALPRYPNQLQIFAIFFELPHIIASLVILIDREYISHYRRMLFVALPAILAAVYLMPLYGYFSTFTLLFAIATAVHVFSQQFGIAKMFGTAPGMAYQIWRWSGLIIGVFISLSLFLGPATLLGIELDKLFLLLSRPAFVVFAAASFILYRRGQDRTNRLYLAANLLFLSALLFFERIDYSFFLILLPRVIHDLTAFAFYMVHDANRNAGTQSPNLIYRLLRFSRISPAVLGPLLALGIALPITLQASQQVGLQIIFVLASTHYLTEAVTWRRGTPHRLQISVR